MYLRVTPLLPFHLPLYTVRITQPTTTRIHPKDEEDPTFDQRRERSVFSLSDRHARILEADYLGESAIYRVERYGSYLSGRKSRVSTAYQERFFHFYLFLEPPPLLLPAIFYLYFLSSVARLVLIETITEQGGNGQRHFDEKRGSSLDDDGRGTKIEGSRPTRKFRPGDDGTLRTRVETSKTCQRGGETEEETGSGRDRAGPKETRRNQFHWFDG